MRGADAVNFPVSVLIPVVEGTDCLWLLSEAFLQVGGGLGRRPAVGPDSGVSVFERLSCWR